MVGTLGEILDNMEEGVFNFCVDGRCSECGQCCSALLPLSNKEIKNIKRYVDKKHLKPHKHGSVFSNEPFDLTCPFLDTSKKEHKCDIYQVRPEICRVFKCNQPPSKVKKNKELFWRTRKAVYVWDLFD